MFVRAAAWDLWVLSAALWLLLGVPCARAETTMTVSGPVVTTGDYIANGTGMLEKRWRYDITNTSSSGDVNNMINCTINAGANNNVLEVRKSYGGPQGNISIFLMASSCGFTGLLPPLGFNSISLYLITPATTPSAPGLAAATAAGTLGNPNIPFPSVAVLIPYLPALQSLESATRAVGGQYEFRYRLGNAGTPSLTSLTIPAGRQ